MQYVDLLHDWIDLISQRTWQILEPVEWSTSVEKISDDTYILVSKTNIEKGWHLYAQDVPEDGPIPTTFSYNLDEEVVLLGLTKELEGHIVDDPVFLMKIKYCIMNQILLNKFMKKSYLIIILLVPVFE